MKKILMVVVALALALVMPFGQVVYANQVTQQRRLFDADGNEVFGGSVFYDENRIPVFGPGCWYWYDNVRVDAQGMDAFIYDADGNLIEAPYGAWCRGWNGGRARNVGRGCCRWRW